MTDNVAQLHIVNPLLARSDEQGIVDSIEKFMIDHEILIDHNEDDVELEQPQSDEVRIAALSNAEKRLFLAASLISEVIKTELIELEASNSEELVKMMREDRITMMEASSRFMENRDQYLSDDQRIFLHKCGATQAVSSNLWQWSLRVRTSEWNSAMIVRKGFVAYTYG